MPLKVGYVPEHFSTPIAFAQSKGYFTELGLNEVELIPYPSGSGHLIQSLGDGSIDIAIGLTEAFVRGLAQGDQSYKLINTYVKSPLRWSVSTGFNRDDVTDIEGLAGKDISVSRIGSGSYVMAFVMALQFGFKQPFFNSFPILSTFKNLRESVNLKEGFARSDAFMWEHFTTKRYYDNQELKKIGEIYTPWPSWVINARSGALQENKEEVTKFVHAVNKGIAYFKENQEEAIQWIHTNLDYSEEDAREWIKTVEFNDDLTNLQAFDYENAVSKTYKVLIETGVLNKEDEKLIVDRIDEGLVKQF
ncbi:hypothetical protein WICPIJ_002421 [Wickerhamomyces pijperi]|uniref:Ca3427-like PBP 2 domain-containing protein n=1 Tax=Wickerhamomyces pijperi TaxID=599730 RepID=A0A9P8QBS6_WICPI|nr:hypothetical protein WICPIJ_002421 [Wickerhamomyces pijperi]